MAARRTSPGKVELQTVLRFIASQEEVAYAPLIGWMTRTFDCRERAAKDNVSVLLKGGWIEKRTHSSEQRRASYRLTGNGHADMAGTLGRTALKRGRRLYSTCLSGRARTRQAAKRQAAPNPLAIALEARARTLYGGAHADRTLRHVVAAGGLLTRRTHRRSPLARTLRFELLGERARDCY
jgi:hypothetical protein